MRGSSFLLIFAAILVAVASLMAVTWVAPRQTATIEPVVTDVGELRQRIRQIEVGAEVEVELVRQGQRRTVRATLTEAPREARQP